MTEMMCQVCPVGVERDRAYAQIADLEAEVRAWKARAAEHRSACAAALVRLQESDLKRALAEADAVDVRTRLGAAQADLDARLDQRKLVEAQKDAETAWAAVKDWINVVNGIGRMVGLEDLDENGGSVTDIQDRVRRKAHAAGYTE